MCTFNGSLWLILTLNKEINKVKLSSLTYPAASPVLNKRFYANGPLSPFTSKVVALRYLYIRPFL